MEAAIVIGILILFIIWRKLPTKGVKVISAHELKTMLTDKNKVFIDVRTPGEYNGRHIAQFKNLPLGSDLSKVPTGKEIVVICQSGMRSNQACKQLKKLGYDKVTNVRGGMNAWRG
ncbi:MAG: rhodanese-like domain-containing protein [Candidatus Pristimantibacillus lignocellulolyticus]|uniref:Rhodanese-like domain-containing protein n=1 Tax=Candidatus Pristimantibacillus lignocellulolyticus TaxID=2994561 RepID=A0A9J6ZC58_9BACL|nr:MAG: rhodanese-like domain-containing protein [Candidatus Pristimantibacillus lignocellulolyticus]